MKVNLKIDPETLFLLHKIIFERCQVLTKNSEDKFSKSIRVELLGLIGKKCISTTDSNAKKQSISLKYHVAAVLFADVKDNKIVFGTYEANKLEMLKNDLHQKLQ